jgi:hypothetical protein
MSMSEEEDSPPIDKFGNSLSEGEAGSKMETDESVDQLEQSLAKLNMHVAAMDPTIPQNLLIQHVEDIRPVAAGGGGGGVPYTRANLFCLSYGLSETRLDTITRGIQSLQETITLATMQSETLKHKLADQLTRLGTFRIQRDTDDRFLYTKVRHVERLELPNLYALSDDDFSNLSAHKWFKALICNLIGKHLIEVLLKNGDAGVIDEVFTLDAYFRRSGSEGKFHFDTGGVYDVQYFSLLYLVPSNPQAVFKTATIVAREALPLKASLTLPAKHGRCVVLNNDTVLHASPIPVFVNAALKEYPHLHRVVEGTGVSAGFIEFPLIEAIDQYKQQEEFTRDLPRMFIRTWHLRSGTSLFDNVRPLTDFGIFVPDNLSQDFATQVLYQEILNEVAAIKATTIQLVDETLGHKTANDTFEHLFHNYGLRSLEGGSKHAESKPPLINEEVKSIINNVEINSMILLSEKTMMSIKTIVNRFNKKISNRGSKGAEYKIPIKYYKSRKVTSKRRRRKRTRHNKIVHKRTGYMTRRRGAKV